MQFFLALKKFGIIKENFYSKIKSPTGYGKIKAQKSDRTGRLIFWDKKILKGAFSKWCRW